MQKRKFGKIGWDISEISLGCWAMGADWGDVSEENAKNILKTSFENGVNFFDTADVYGDGRSEKFVGEFINSTSERVYVATKAGRRISPHEAQGYYDKDLIESYVDRSLKNLSVETIDLLQMHCPPTEVYSHDLTYEMLDYLVTKGKIQHYGFSVQTVEEAITCIQRPHTKSVQIIFNMLRLKPSEEFFQMAKDKNIAIIVRVPLASGLLTGKMNSNSSFPENDHRNYNINGDAFDVGETFSGVDFTKALKVVEELKSIIPDGFSLSQLALKWILMHDAVSVVIPGAKNSDQVLSNISASSLHNIDDLMKKIEDIYVTHLKDHIHPRW
ncbi:aldo/keto reductase [Alphaproteobacteria bacterium]|nr:aldo/keto reductase [Alphaproteobacteria bacterium]